MKDLHQHKARRRWIIRLLILIELICMGIGVACMLFPPRWQVFTLILLGAREIMFKAHTKMKYTDKQEAKGNTDYGKEKEYNSKAKQKDNNRGKNRGKQERKRGKARNAEPKGRE